MSLLDPDAEVFKSFTVGCTVVLQNLSATQYNGQIGMVITPLSNSGRQQIRVEDDAIISVKPSNLGYAPCEISSLSVEQMKRELKSPILLANPALRRFDGDKSGIDSLMAALFGRIPLGGKKSLANIDSADEEGLVSMMEDLLQNYSVDLATYLAILRRKEQDNVIREGAINLFVPSALRANEERPMSKVIMVNRDEPFDDDYIRYSTHVPHYKRCSKDEIEYIMCQQEYFAKTEVQIDTEFA
ncbi:hypothetical protein ACHAXN_010272 [Cyclotella atomus]